MGAWLKVVLGQVGDSPSPFWSWVPARLIAPVLRGVPTPAWFQFLTVRPAVQFGMPRMTPKVKRHRAGPAEHRGMPATGIRGAPVLLGASSILEPLSQVAMSRADKPVRLVPRRTSAATVSSASFGAASTSTSASRASAKARRVLNLQDAAAVNVSRRNTAGSWTDSRPPVGSTPLDNDRSTKGKRADGAELAPHTSARRIGLEKVSRSWREAKLVLLKVLARVTNKGSRHPAVSLYCPFPLCEVLSIGSLR